MAVRAGQVARALLADVDMIIINRTVAAMNHASTQRMYDSLRKWVDEGLPGMSTVLGGDGVTVPRLRTVSISSWYSVRRFKHQPNTSHFVCYSITIHASMAGTVESTRPRNSEQCKR